MRGFVTCYLGLTSTFYPSLQHSDGASVAEDVFPLVVVAFSTQLRLANSSATAAPPPPTQSNKPRQFSTHFSLFKILTCVLIGTPASLPNHDLPKMLLRYNCVRMRLRLESHYTVIFKLCGRKYQSHKSPLLIKIQMARISNKKQRKVSRDRYGSFSVGVLLEVQPFKILKQMHKWLLNVEYVD